MLLLSYIGGTNLSMSIYSIVIVVAFGVNLRGGGIYARGVSLTPIFNMVNFWSTNKRL